MRNELREQVPMAWRSFGGGSVCPILDDRLLRIGKVGGQSYDLPSLIDISSGLCGAGAIQRRLRWPKLCRKAKKL